MSSEELEKLLENIVNVAQRGSRQTRDGSHLTEDGLDKAKKQIETNFAKEIEKANDEYWSSLNKANKNLEDIDKALNNIDRSFGDREEAIRKAGQEAGKTTAEIDTEIAKRKLEFQKRLEEEKKSIFNTINGFDDKLNEMTEAITKAKEEIEKNANQEAKDNVYRMLSSGKSDRVARKGENISEFGNSLNRVGKIIGNKKGLGGLGKIIGGVGGALGKFGSLLTKAAGPIGLVAQAAMMAHKFWTQTVELDNKQRAFKAQDIGRSYDIATTKFNAIAQMANNEASAIQQVVSNNQSAASSAQSAMGAFAQEAVGIHSDLAVEGRKIEYDAYATAHEIASELPFDIKNSVYKAAEASIDFATRAQNYETNDKYAGKAIDIAHAKMSNQISGAYAVAATNNEAIMRSMEIQNETISKINSRNVELMRQDQSNARIDNSYQQAKGRAARNSFGLSNMYYGAYRDVTYSQEKSQRDYDYNVKKSQYGYLNATDEKISGLMAQNETFMASQRAFNIQQSMNARDINLSIQKSQQDMYKQIDNAANEAASKIAKAWLKMTEKLNDTFIKHQHASTIMGREMGLTGDKLEKYSEKMSEYQVGVAKWGKDLEWMQKLQGGYQDYTGRNIELSQRDFETSAALGLNVGDETIAQYVSGMEIFNHSVEDSNEKLYTMFKDVSKIGLNGKKYAKDVAQNLKLAEKYNFKEGTKSLREMVKWAQNMRFNMGSLDGMLDKVQEGGLEGVIKQAAELQVLGGNFSMGSDPMAMAYESYMDPEAYAKRMNSMIAGQGFLKENGEVGFGIASQQMMRQYAKSTGQDYKEVLNQARAQVKLGAIESNLNGNFTDDQKSLIANKAQYDQESGKWQVQIGKRKVDVDSLTEQDLEDLTPSEDIAQDTLTALQDVRSIQEQYNGQQIENMARLETELWTPLKETNERILKSVGEDFNTNFETYKGEAITNLGVIEEAQGQFMNMFKEGNDAVDQKLDAILNKALNIGGTINKIVDSASSHIASAMSESVNAICVKIQDLSNAIKKLKEEANKDVDDDEINEYLTAIKNNDQKWLSKAGKDGTREAAIVERLALNYGDVEEKIGNAKGFSGQTKAYGQTLLGYYDPSGDVGTMHMSVEQKKRLQARMDAYGDVTKKYRVGSNWGGQFAEGVTTYSNAAPQQNNIPKGEITSQYERSRQFGGDGVVSPNGKLTKINDGKIDNNGHPIKKINDGPIDENGLVVQNGIPTLIDKNDQVLAAKNGGPLDRLMDMAIEPMRAAQRAEEEYKRAMEGIKEERENVRQRLIIEAVQASTQLGNTNPSNNAKLLNQLVSGGGFLKENGEVSFGISTQMMMRQFADVTGQDYEDVLNEAREMVREAYYDPEKLMKHLGTSSSNDWESILTKTNSETSRTDVTTVQQHQNSSSNWADVSSHPMSYEGNGINTTHNSSNWTDVSPRPMPYDSYVKENPYSGSSNNNNSNSGRIEISPIQININGSIQLSGGSGNVDITQQIANDPNFIRSLSQLISMEVEKKVRGGRVVNPLNRGLEY